MFAFAIDIGRVARCFTLRTAIFSPAPHLARVVGTSTFLVFSSGHGGSVQLKFAAGLSSGGRNLLNLGRAGTSQTTKLPGKIRDQLRPTCARRLWEARRQIRIRIGR